MLTTGGGGGGLLLTGGGGGGLLLTTGGGNGTLFNGRLSVFEFVMAGLLNGFVPGVLFGGGGFLFML